MAARVPKTRANGTMTEAGFRGFIRSALRQKSMYWLPKKIAKQRARHPVKLPNEKGRLVYHATCAECGQLHPETLTDVDHRIPVVDPKVGFTTWDEFIDRLFCEVDNWQVLCKPCHLEKTNAEKGVATERRKK